MGIKSAKAKKRHDKKRMAGQGPAQVPFKDEFQEYGKITKLCGNCRFMVQLPDMKEYIGILCKRMYKRAWLSIDQIVLVSRRDFQADKVDIIHRYSDEEVRTLVQLNEITQKFATSHRHQDDPNGDVFDNTVEEQEVATTLLDSDDDESFVIEDI